jgi:Peptidase family M28
MYKNNMKKFFLTGLLISITSFLLAQNIDKIINAREVDRIENKLASDEMRGRKTFTPDIDRAADFIVSEFKTIGLQTWNNNGSYRQDFSMISLKLLSSSCTFDNKEVDPKNVVVITSSTGFYINEKSGYEKTVIAAGKNLTTEARKLVQSKKNLLVLVDTGYLKNFNRLSGLKRQLFKSDYSVVFVLSVDNPSTFTVEARHEITEQKLANVVGIIPGKSKKDEYVIFSGHYDHLGVTSNPVNGDSIYNGANDDAAGTTAVIMLAKYFKAVKNNERTIVFVAFTAEEIGGFGSQYFSQQFADPAKVMAMFNIEMIGTESKWGKNSAYITGYEKTDMGKILEKNLEGTGFTFYPDPYTTQNLFYRSDNATLARLGVPAHTISTSKMDSEPNYHKLSDQVETLDMDNMAMIIKSVALSARSIIRGKDSPTRVKVDELR